MTSADVKFSIDDARKQSKGWGYIDAPIKTITAPDPETVVVQAQVQAGRRSWPTSRCSRTGSSRRTSAASRAPTSTRRRSAPARSCGTRAWSARRSRSSSNPNYWQKGKPYLDKVTWSYVTDDNTRELQLRGNQIQVDEFPPFNSITKLQNTPDVKMNLFPSTRTDYLVMNHERQAAGRRARAPGDLLRDRPQRRSSSPCCSATASRPTRSCRRRCRSTTRTRRASSTTWPRPRQELAQSAYPKGFKVEMLLGSGDQTPEPDRRRSCSRRSSRWASTSRSRPRTQSTAFADIQALKYQLGFSYWTMDIADPDELVTFAVDTKGGGAHSFFTDYNNPKSVVALAPGASTTRTRPSARSCTRRSRQIARRRRVPRPRCTTRRSATPTGPTSRASWCIRSATTTSRTSGSADEPPGVRRPAPAGADPDRARRLDPGVHADAPDPGRPGADDPGQQGDAGQASRCCTTSGASTSRCPCSTGSSSGGSVHGDLGTRCSTASARAALVWQKLPVTLFLIVFGGLLSMVIAVPLALLAAHEARPLRRPRSCASCRWSGSASRRSGSGSCCC